MLANGLTAKIGTHLSPYRYFHDWKRLNENEDGSLAMETLLRGVCDRRHFLDLVENYILFDETADGTKKILARNHQFLGVNQAVEAVRNREHLNGRLGVFWHTQGSGKSYSMVLFTRKVHRKLAGGFTFVVLTDRDDLDDQLYRTFAGCGVVDQEKDACRAGSGAQLRTLLGQHKTHVFTLIQKFNQRVDPDNPADAYSQRDDVIVMSDEAHRTQYGDLALNLRNALPNAAFIGFTGTPLIGGDELTKRVFGDYVSKYGFKRATDDGATVPLHYDARGERLGVATTELNERVAEKLAELEEVDIDTQQRLEAALKKEYHVITAQKRLEQVADDFVRHCSTGWQRGKAMLVCVDKVTCVRMHGLIKSRWRIRIKDLEAKRDTLDKSNVEGREALGAQIAWMEETITAVVVSEEQGEVAKFRDWDLDIKPHRRLLKEGFPQADGKHLDVEDAFKSDRHPFRIAIVCAMWLTGFDVPSLGTLYLDKPLRAHTLMQAIARANRVHAGKANGLIVDYCGILKNLRQALATFAGGAGGTGDGPGDDPVRPEEELLERLDEALDLVQGVNAAGGGAAGGDPGAGRL